ncbi:MAG TPA: lipoyl synthase [Acidimicrobiales bacterium]|nr:lipoyl synthase [Acidimicrobiales bacterium]
MTEGCDVRPGSTDRPLHIRWLGRVPYQDAHALQQGLFAHGPDSHLLLLEHPHVYTLGLRGDLGHLIRAPEEVGADLVHTDRGGDVTYHGPGQLVGYPILSLPGRRGGGLAETSSYVCSLEQLVIDALADIGLPGASRLEGFPGVWVGAATAQPRKICAIGVRLSRGRTMHGFALNVDPDLAMFGHIVPCGIADKGVTSLSAEGVQVTMAEVVDAVAARAAERWGSAGWDRADVVWRHSPEDLSAFSRGAGAGEPVRPDAHTDAIGVPVALSPARRGSGTTARRQGRLTEAGVTDAVAISDRKPDWMRAPLRLTPEVTAIRRTMRDLGLVTVCEEAGCPNLSECWSDGTATFMINGERCTRACGFCLVDTRHPDAPDPREPERVAEAVAQMGLRFAVVTTVARDDLPRGGADEFAAVIRAIRARTPGVSVEVLISDCTGDPEALEVIFAERPDVLNHNLETVARLQRAARPSAGYARSLAVLARAKAAGLTTKSSLIAGMGETRDEMVQALTDLRGVGVDIVTIGQYLRPTTNHLPVARWWTPDELHELKVIGEAMGIGHVEAGPLVRSSYHARQAADAAGPPHRPAPARL